MNITNIDEIPFGLLGEIISRLGCCKLIFQCKCVSKRWCTFISNPYFIACFLRLQIDRQTPTMATLINCSGEKLHKGMSTTSLSSSTIVTQLLKRLASCYDLNQEPIVVATYNDLVLCCAANPDKFLYYICNPYTTQCVALPPPPSRYPDGTAKVVGIVCDTPYYNYYYKEHHGEKRLIIKLNAEYKCRVVRLLADYDIHSGSCVEIKVEVFCSETGEWSEQVIISPRPWYQIYSSIAHNGMLYHLCQLNRSRTCLVGLDPFMMTNTITNSDHYTCHPIEMENEGNVEGGFRGDECVVCEQSLRMCYFDWDTFSVYDWDLKEEEEEEEGGGHHGIGKLCWKNTGVYEQDRGIAPEEESLITVFELIAVDPNDDDVLYWNINGEIVMCDIRTRKWSNIDRETQDIHFHFFRLVLPWWPTPVPKLLPKQRDNILFAS